MTTPSAGVPSGTVIPAGDDEDSQAQETLSKLAGGDGKIPEGETPEQTIARLQEDSDKWKNLSRKHEDDVKKYRPKAQQLDKLTDAAKTEQERLQDQNRELSDGLSGTQLQLNRLQVALEYGIYDPKDPEALELLGSGDRDSMVKLAERIAKLANTAAGQNGGQGAGQQQPNGHATLQDALNAAGVGRGRRPVEGLRAGGTPGMAGTGPESKNDLIRGMLGRD